MRILRQTTGKSLRLVATTMGLSPAYISDLELGRRDWRPELVESYRKAVRQ